MLQESLLQLLTVHEVNDVRQTELHTAETPLAECSAFQVEMTVEKLKTHKSLGTDSIIAELFWSERKRVDSKILKVTWNIDKVTVY